MTDQMGRAIAGISLVFEREQLDLIQVDSVDVELSWEKGINSIGALFPGQRMDFVLRPPQGSGKQSSMTVQLDQEYDYMPCEFEY